MSCQYFTVFYRQHHGALLAVARRRVADPSTAEDIASEVFGIAWARHHRDGGDLTVPWLYQVLRNVVGSEYRRTARADALATRLHLDPPDDPAPVVDEHALDVRHRLLELTAPDREVLYLAYWADLPAVEIAAVCGCSPTAARLRLMRARRRLGSLLDSVPTPASAAQIDTATSAPP